MTTKLLPSQILDKAGDLISQPGAWHQGAWFDTNSYRALKGDYKCMCAQGALILAAGSAAISICSSAWARCWTPHYFLEQAVGAISVADWNDEDGRTQEEVVRAFRDAAELARGQNQ